MIFKTITAALLATTLVAGAASAQTTTAPSTTPAPSTTQPTMTSKATAKVAKAAKAVKAKTTKQVRSEASLACSAEANAKNLHGKERRKFRKSCLAMKAKAVKG